MSQNYIPSKCVYAVFQFRANRYDLGLSNEPLFSIIGQGDAKLWPVKVGGLKKLPYLSFIYLVKWSSQFELYQGRIFFGHSFAESWLMMINSGSFESPKSYMFALNLKNSIVALLRYVILAQTIPIYYIK